MWSFVIPHFNSFLENIELTQVQHNDAITKAHNVGSSLHAKYYSGPYNPNTIRIVGSYGKGTAIRPSTDIDMLFILPVSNFDRTNRLSGNSQSRLLQEGKQSLTSTFPRTDLRTDGQIIKIPFASYSVEVVPAFICNDGTFLLCNTGRGGSWKRSNPSAEYRDILVIDYLYRGKATHLIKMLKAWKQKCNVNIKSLLIEIAACSFIRQWPYKQQTIWYYDWMIRDFFEFLYKHINGTAWVPGTGEQIPMGDSWSSKCRSAYSRAMKACEYEYKDRNFLAEDEWKKIFGNQFCRLGLTQLLKSNYGLLGGIRAGYGQ